MSKRMLFVAIFCGLIALLAQPVSLRAAAPALTGSWQFTLTQTSPTVTAQIPGLATFTSDGSMTETNGLELVPVVGTTATGAGHASAGHGIWQLGPSMTFFYIQYYSVVVNSNGALISTNITTMDVTPTSTGTNFSGSYTTATVNPSGITLKTVSGTVSGQLIPHPPLP